jgi:hypothetical protein
MALQSLWLDQWCGDTPSQRGVTVRYFKRRPGIAGVCSANGIVTIQIAPRSLVATPGLDFFDTLRAPKIEQAVIELETAACTRR